MDYGRCEPARHAPTPYQRTASGYGPGSPGASEAGASAVQTAGASAVQTAPGGEAGTPVTVPLTLKVLVAGGFGAGKTTLINSLSEIPPLRTEEQVSLDAPGADDTSGVEAKTTTTVAMDFGRITLSDDLVLYLFGTPGQERFWFAWDELSLGAVGAIVLADTRRLAACFPAVDYFERRGTPFIVAVNCFDGARRYKPQDVRHALDLDPEVPVVLCDARRRGSGKDMLITLVEHAMKADWMRAVDSPVGAGVPQTPSTPGAGGG